MNLTKARQRHGQTKVELGLDKEQRQDKLETKLESAKMANWMVIL